MNRFVNFVKTYVEKGNFSAGIFVRQKDFFNNFLHIFLLNL